MEGWRGEQKPREERGWKENNYCIMSYMSLMYSVNDIKTKRLVGGMSQRERR